LRFPSASIGIRYQASVPGDVSGNKINVVRRVALLLSAPVRSDDDGESGVAALFVAEARLYLNAKQAAAMLHNCVVRIAVSVRTSDADTLHGGAIHECEFGKIAHTPGAEMSGGHVVFSSFQSGVPCWLDECVPVTKGRK